MAKKTVPAEPDTPRGDHRAAAYFLSLTVENVRCFGKKQTLNLTDKAGRPARWTILIGNNGTGKTTLLQLLAGLEIVQQPNHDLKSDPFHRWEFSARGIVASFWGRHECSYRRSPGLRGAWGATIALGLPLTTSDAPFAMDQLELTLHEQGAMGITYQRDLSQFANLQCYAYGASRRLGRTSLAKDTSDDPVATLFWDSADLSNAEEWLLKLDYACRIPSTIQHAQQRRLEQVKHLLVKVLFEVEEIRFTSPKATNPTPQVEFKTPYGWVPLRQLGYGYQTLVAWVTDLASRLVERYPDSPNPLAEPAIVLVDEIDLHLHPKWQRMLLELLSERFPNTQFIATAHSPLVVQAASEANLAVLKRVDDYVVIDNDVDRIRGWRVDQILTSDLFDLPSTRPPQFDDLLARRQAILQQKSLTPGDKRELAEIEEKIGSLPVAETSEAIKLMSDIHETLRAIKQRQGIPQ